MIALSSARGLRVELPEADYAGYLSRCGSRAREVILSDAGAVLKRRRVIAAGVTALSDSEREQVDFMAWASARSRLVDARLCERGYESGVARVRRGGLMPPSWGREVARAAADVDDRDVIVTEDDRDLAAQELFGVITADDIEYSQRASAAHAAWLIYAPDGWGP